MNFNKHSNLSGLHTFLSPSNYQWLRYNEDKLYSSYIKWKNKEIGTQMHEFAHQCIEMGISLFPNNETLDLFVNDAIKYQMSSEQVLYFSENCFGTADAISFDNKVLRISDLKTGVNLASMDQLKIYAALFCLEYGINPHMIDIELRIYQGNRINEVIADSSEILYIMDRIIFFDKLISDFKEEL